MYIRFEAMKASEDLNEKIDLDAEFKPNLLNTGIYLVSLVMQISTFAINYQVILRGEDFYPFFSSFHDEILNSPSL